MRSSTRLVAGALFFGKQTERGLSARGCCHLARRRAGLAAQALAALGRRTARTLPLPPPPQ